MPFKPSIKLTLALLLLAVVFLRLGWWQMQRKAEKTELFLQFEQAPAMELERALERSEPFARVEAWGRYDPDRHILLDNRILDGRAGVHVLTPFRLHDDRTILVNRGWLPMPPDRRSLPVFSTDASQRSIAGILNRLPGGGPQLGDPDALSADRWPQLVTYLERESVAAALGSELPPWLIQLDAQDASGFEGRDWQPAVMGPEVHGAYALQWFALALAALIIWVTLGIRRAQLLANGSRENGKRT
jgi:surfeit locus 1 family protein